MIQVDGTDVVGVGETVIDGQNHELVVQRIRGVALKFSESIFRVAAVGLDAERGVCVVFAVEIEQVAGIVHTIPAQYIFRIDESAVLHAAQVRTQRSLVRGFDEERELAVLESVVERVCALAGALQHHAVLGEGSHIGVVDGIVFFFPYAVEREVVGGAFAGGKQGRHAGKGARGEEYFSENLFHNG